MNDFEEDMQTLGTLNRVAHEMAHQRNVDVGRATRWNWHTNLATLSVSSLHLATIGFCVSHDYALGAAIAFTSLIGFVAFLHAETQQ